MPWKNPTAEQRLRIRANQRASYHRRKKEFAYVRISLRSMQEIRGYAKARGDSINELINTFIEWGLEEFEKNALKNGTQDPELSMSLNFKPPD